MPSDARYGDLQYGGDLAAKIAFFQEYILDCIPPAYIVEDQRDFWRDFMWYGAQDLANFNRIFDLIPTYINASTAPAEWVNWMLSEWWGWRLIPERYPLERRRRLLAHLNQHYKRRYTAIGIKGLLGEFGIIADVIDERLYVGSWVGQRGVPRPLHVWITVHYIESFERPLNNYVGNYVGYTWVYTTRPIVDQPFAAALCEWNRPAGIHQVIDFYTPQLGPRLLAQRYDQPIIIETRAPFADGTHIKEPQE